MKKLRLPFRLTVVCIFAMLMLVAFSQGGSSVVSADGIENRVACWTSGPLDEPFSYSDLGLEGFGSLKEFVVDRRDLVGFVDGRYELEADKDALGADGKNRLSVFRDFPEFIDLAFYMPTEVGDVNWYLPDGKVKHLNTLLGGGAVAEDELPWEDADEYFKRRAVARRDKGRVKMFSSRWKSPEKPGGGVGVDMEAVVGDRAAQGVELVSGTTSRAEKGFRRELYVQEFPSVAVQHTSEETCSLGVCTETYRTKSHDVTTTTQGMSLNSNDGEEMNFGAGADVRPLAVRNAAGDVIKVVEEQVHNEYVEPSTLLDRKDLPSAYGEVAQRDTDRNQIQIDITLKPLHRADYEFNAGGAIGNLQLPGMGFSGETYSNIGKLRDGRFNDLDFTGGGGILGDADRRHYGFRQPGLDPAMSGSSRGSVLDNVEHIKWPVFVEDMNWYLYKLPGENREEKWSLLWISDEGGKWLVESGYGESAVAYGEKLPGADPDCSLKDDVKIVRIDKVECNRSVSWDSGKASKGEQVGVYLPFEVRSGPAHEDHMLGVDDLVKAGVESPLDAGPNPGRKLNRFFFVIDEGSKFGSEVEVQGGVGLDKFGAPHRRKESDGEDTPSYERFVEDWPGGPIDPNRAYLFVFTFYESRNPLTDSYGIRTESKLKVKGEDFDEKIKLPRRFLRRVICRALVYPSGIEPPVDENRNFFERMFSTVTDGITWAFHAAKGIAGDMGRGVVKLPMYGVKQTANVACTGLGRLDKLTDLGGREVAEETVAGPDGRLRVNNAVRSKRIGSEHCYRIGSPEVSTCEGGTDLVFKGYCANLPELKLVERKYDFIDPIEVDGGEVKFKDYEIDYLNSRDSAAKEEDALVVGGKGVKGAVVKGVKAVGAEDNSPVSPVIGRGKVVVGDNDSLYWEKKIVETRFRPVWTDDSAPPPDHVRQSFEFYQGLTATRVEWGYRWPGVRDDIESAIDGYVVHISPDPRASQGVAPGEWRKFEIPKWVKVKRDIDDGSIHTIDQPMRVEGFWIGGLDSGGGKGSNSLVRVGRKDEVKSVVAIGTKRSDVNVAAFNNFVDGLPLAPGFEHRVRVAPYNGYPGTADFRVGTLSEVIVLDGGEAACSSLEFESMTEEMRRRIVSYYDCADQVVVGSASLGDDFRIGLLELSGTDICGDIFSSTPAELTWDNAVVKRVWLLMWILAGGVLFSLFVWQGVRMTYDVWIDPQPAVGLRELVPRFMLAIILAVGSLALARLVLVLSSDVTCFVAQMTGMSMWGVIGVTFGSIMDGVSAWMRGVDENISGYALASLMVMGPITLGIALLVLVFVIFILILFVKVAFGMLMRLAFLAALIAVAPLAFALYASDTTAKFTSWWVKAFLGAACQQVFVLVVIYLGSHMVGTYMAEAADGDLQVMMIGLMLALLTLALAESVPKIVNPAGQGMFEGFGKMASMAAMGAVMVASGGAAAAARGASGAMAGFRAGGAAGGAGGGGALGGASASSISMRTRGGGGGDSGDDGQAGQPSRPGNDPQSSPGGSYAGLARSGTMSEQGGQEQGGGGRTSEGAGGREGSNQGGAGRNLVAGGAVGAAAGALAGQAGGRTGTAERERGGQRGRESGGQPGAGVVGISGGGPDSQPRAPGSGADGQGATQGSGQRSIGATGADAGGGEDGGGQPTGNTTVVGGGQAPPGSTEAGSPGGGDGEQGGGGTPGGGAAVSTPGGPGGGEPGGPGPGETGGVGSAASGATGAGDNSGQGSDQGAGEGAGPSFRERAMLGALRFGDRLQMAALYGTDGALGGARSGARFGGRLNDQMSRVASGRAFTVARGGDGGQRQLGAMSSYQERFAKDLNEKMDKLAQSVGKIQKPEEPKVQQGGG